MKLLICLSRWEVLDGPWECKAAPMEWQVWYLVTRVCPSGYADMSYTQCTLLSFFVFCQIHFQIINESTFYLRHLCNSLFTEKWFWADFWNERPLFSSRVQVFIVKCYAVVFCISWQPCLNNNQFHNRSLLILYFQEEASLSQLSHLRQDHSPLDLIICKDLKNLLTKMLCHKPNNRPNIWSV